MRVHSAVCAMARCLYAYRSSFATGECIELVSGTEASLVLYYSVGHLFKNAGIFLGKLVPSSTDFTAFFATVRRPSQVSST